MEYNNLQRRRVIKSIGTIGAVLVGGSATAAAKEKEEWDGQKALDDHVLSLAEEHGEPQITAEHRIHNGNTIRKSKSVPDHANSRVSSHGNVILTNVFDFPEGPTITNHVARRGRNLFIEFDENLHKIKVPNEPAKEVKKSHQRLEQKEREDRKERFENKNIKESEN